MAWTVLLSLALLSTTVSAELGLDAIDPISTSTFQCLKNNGYDFYIGRVWKSTGTYDNQGMQNNKNAKAAGLTYVDAYIFPCLASHCAHAANQVEATINQVRSSGTPMGTLWLDVERFAWPSDKNSNRNFITAMANQAESMGVTVGIYTNYYNWEEIVGLDWAGMSKYPLWYAAYNGHQDFSGFKGFGGWSKPNIHQYTGDVDGACGVNMDQNWYPG